MHVWPQGFPFTHCCCAAATNGNATRPISRTRPFTNPLLLQYQEQGPGETARGPYNACAQPMLRRDIAEVDEHRTAAGCQRERVTQPARARGPARREGLMPTALDLLTHRIGAGWQTGERVVPGAISERHSRHRTAEIDAPVRETGEIGRDVLENLPF